MRKLNESGFVFVNIDFRKLNVRYVYYCLFVNKICIVYIIGNF